MRYNPRTVAEYSKTAVYWPEGAAIVDQYSDWIVACELNKHTILADQVNYRAILDLLGGQSDTVRSIRYGCLERGSSHILIVHPSRSAELHGIHFCMVEQGSLDLDEFHSLEQAYAIDIWRSISIDEKLRICRRFKCRKSVAYLPYPLPSMVQHLVYNYYMYIWLFTHIKVQI